MSAERNPSERSTLLHGDLTGRIVGAFFEVHRALGFGFLESVYSHALLHELRRRGLVADREVGCSVTYREVVVGQFSADIIVNGLVVLELKTARMFDPTNVAQLLNYLRSTELELGLLLNFGQRAQFERVVFTNNRKRTASADHELAPP